MIRPPRARGVIAWTAAAALLVILPALPALSVTKAQVDKACADSQQQLADYRAARGRFDAANTAWEDTQNQIDQVQRKQQVAASAVAEHEATIAALDAQVQDQAVQLYMDSGFAGPGLVLSAESVDQLITGREFLAATSGSDLSTLGDLETLRSDLQGFQKELVDTEAELHQIEAQRKTTADDLQAAAQSEHDTYVKLAGTCRSLVQQYDLQQAIARARAAARQGSAAAGVPASATPGFICPSPTATFRDTWGAPRSGGRTHKGVDMFAPFNVPLYAVADGTVVRRTGGLGGNALWLNADYGVGFYYAHLSGWAVQTGQRVKKGQVIGYNGNTGDAYPGPPHLHFEIHPGGRGSPAVNPYPTVARACR